VNEAETEQTWIADDTETQLDGLRNPGLFDFNVDQNWIQSLILGESTEDENGSVTHIRPGESDFDYMSQQK
jgi:hypothetical protein